MKNGNFIGQKTLPLENFEINLVKNILPVVYNTTTCMFELKLSEPKSEFKTDTKDTIVNLTTFYFDINKQLGWNSQPNDYNTPYNSISYSLYIYTDGKIRKFRAKKFIPYEPDKHFFYNTDLVELLNDVSQTK